MELVLVMSPIEWPQVYAACNWNFWTWYLARTCKSVVRRAADVVPPCQGAQARECPLRLLLALSKAAWVQVACGTGLRSQLFNW